MDQIRLVFRILLSNLHASSSRSWAAIARAPVGVKAETFVHRIGNIDFSSAHRSHSIDCVLLCSSYRIESETKIGDLASETRLISARQHLRRDDSQTAR